MASPSSVLGGGSVLRAADVDVGRARERRRQRRLARLAAALAVVCWLAWWRGLSGGSLNPLAGFSLGPDAIFWLPMVLVVVVICLVMLVPMLGQGRSPHLLYRPEQIDVGLDDVKGLGSLHDEVVKTLNLFLGYATFKDRLGGNPRRGICSRASRAPARPTWPRRWPATPGCRSCSSPPPASSRCGTA